MSSPENENKICLFLVWFGPWPKYFPYFIESCIRNPEITWKIFSDNSPPESSYEHIQFTCISAGEIEQTAMQKLGSRVSMADPYKVCDLKPAFGKLFSEHLEGIDYWGYCDMDVIWGNIAKFLYTPLSESPDILSCYPGFLSGPLTIYRNSPQVNSLYQECPTFGEILKTGQCQGFDENITRKEISGWSFKKVALFLQFLIERHWKDSWKKDLRYHFQWFVKRNTIRSTGPVDMTEVVWNASSNRRIKAGFFPLLWSEPYFNRTSQKGWKFASRNDGLFDELSNREIMGFHFQESKSKPAFKIMPGELHGKVLYIDEAGLWFK